MTDRPILFSGPMVRAILDGSKTQTRRVAKLPPASNLGEWVAGECGGPKGGRTANGETIPLQANIWHTRSGVSLLCPYGQPGDRLWVREAWAKPQVAQSFGGSEWFVYREGDNRTDYGGPWKPSIHMPRAASRITLEITAVRIERLQDTSEADAKAEGCEPLVWNIPDGTAADLIDWPLKAVDRPYANAYALLWQSINGPGSWDANPWVWVVEFRRLP